MSDRDSHLFGTLQANDGSTYYLDAPVAYGDLVPTQALLNHIVGGGDEFSFGGIPYKDQQTPLVIRLREQATPALLDTALAALLAGVKPGVSWSVTLVGATSARRALVVMVSPRVSKPRGGLQASVAFTITTRPGWRGLPVTGTNQTITSLFGYYDLPAPNGTLPADTAVWFSSVQASKGFAWGIRSDPPAAFAPLQDYAAIAATATAKGGNTTNVALDASTFDASAFAAGAATLDANAHRGPSGAPGYYALFARWLQSATTGANVTVCAKSSVTGSGIASTTSVPTVPPIASTAAVPTALGFEVARVGDVMVPANDVPSVATGGGFGADAAQITQGTGGYGLVAPANYGVFQTVTVATAMRATGVVLHTTAANTYVGTEQIILYPGLPNGGASGIAVGSVWFSAGADSPLCIFTSPVDVSAGTYSIRVGAGPGTLAGLVLDGVSASAYAGGNYWSDSSTSVTAQDMKFDLRGQLPLGFNCSVAVGFAIAAAEVANGHIAELDQTALVPIDEGACIYTPASALAAGQGTLTDAQAQDGSVGVYLANSAGGVGASVLGSGCEVRGNPRVRPGVVNRFVTVAYVPSDAIPGNGTIRIDHTPVWRSPLEA